MNVIKKPRKSKKFNFILKNINTDKIDQKYGISIVSNLTHNNDEQPVNTTKLSELNDIYSNNHTESISFLDETKRMYQCCISMIDFNSGDNVTNLTNYYCFWCKHPFETNPIGCPIRYVSNKGVKNYYSEISKDKYIIKENVTEYKKNLLSSSEESRFIFIPIKSNNSSNISNITIQDNSYYLTDGIFCSFNCCKAYINENNYNSLYEHSNFLLTKLYNELIKYLKKENMKNINPAPHWRLLKVYGGHLSINQFRESFNKTQYEFHDIVFLKNKFKPLTNLFEEKINF